jgi:CheY-like chemotaxis protein
LLHLLSSALRLQYFMGRLIFFIDDDKVILNLLEYTFQSRRDYDVVCYKTGEECLENLHQEPNLIVLDHILESMDEHSLNGLETLKEIRKVNKEVPVVILTGQGDDQLLSEFMENGADKYLTKDDYFINSLIETIEQALG